MKSVDINEFSSEVRSIFHEASELIYPRTILMKIDNTKWAVQGHTSFDEYGNVNINIQEGYADDYTVSHELLHIVIKNHGVPDLVYTTETMKNSFMSLIGTELQGYLEHNWIKKEQIRRGITIDEFSIYHELTESIGKDIGNVNQDYRRILIICNIIRTFPSVFKYYYNFLARNNAFSLKCAEKIMLYYPTDDIYSCRNARKYTVTAIKEWARILADDGCNWGDPSKLICVAPVFSNFQLGDYTINSLGMLPEAILLNSFGQPTYILFTKEDEQCCSFFSYKGPVLKLLQSLENETLREFLAKRKGLPYYPE